MKIANNFLKSLILISFLFWLVSNVFGVDETTIGTATAIAKSSTWIEIEAPITGDDNNNSYTYVEIGASEGGPFDFKDILNGPNEWRINAITGLSPGTTYYVRFTFYDSDGVLGTNPQIVPVTTLLTASNSVILEPAMVIMDNTEIFVSVPITDDANCNSYGIIYVGTSQTGPWAEKCGTALPFHPKKGRIRSLIPGTDYYIRLLIVDPDGVVGTNPQIIGPIYYSGFENIALGKSITADPGWGCCPYPAQLVDGRIQYPSWSCGFAWTGGNRHWAGGPAGWKQATIDFGEPATFNRAVVWYQNPSSVPVLWNFQYSDDGVNFFDAYINTEPCCRTYTQWCYGAWYYPACGHDATFSPVTARYFRYTFDDTTLFDYMHGWAVEIEVYNTIINQAPIAICKDIEVFVDENCQATIAAEDVDGGSYDPDGDEITLSVDNLGPFGLGEHWVNLTVTDESGESDTCRAKVTVVDTNAPEPNITSLPTVMGECSAEITSVPTATDNCAGIINGTTTDPLSYTKQGTYTVTWTYDDGNGNIATQAQTLIVKDTTPPKPNITSLPTVMGECSAEITSVPTATDNCAGIINGTTTDPLSYTEQGTYTVTWTYDDGNGNIATQAQTVIVKDTTPPNIWKLIASPSVLWPPNHKMVPITLTVSASDNCDSNSICQIVSVISNEPENGLGDGDKAPDWEITGTLTVNLRAERSGKGDGRVYTIKVRCTDNAGNFSDQLITVTVPHDKR
jgi:hypothetical protein